MLTIWWVIVLWCDIISPFRCWLLHVHGRCGHVSLLWSLPIIHLGYVKILCDCAQCAYAIGSLQKQTYFQKRPPLTSGISIRTKLSYVNNPGWHTHLGLLHRLKFLSSMPMPTFDVTSVGRIIQVWCIITLCFELETWQLWQPMESPRFKDAPSPFCHCELLQWTCP